MACLMLRRSELTKYEGAPAAAFTGHMYVSRLSSLVLDIHFCRTDECFKSAPYLTSYIKDGRQDIVAPWNLATGHAGSLWQWYQEPDNLWRFHRFMAAMKALRFPLSVYTESLDWESLPPDSVVVDVGGGVGPVTYELYKAFPHLKYVVQDLAPVVKDAENVASRRVLCMASIIMILCSSGLKSLLRLLKMGACR
jgi:hypothetical protein